MRLGSSRRRSCVIAQQLPHLGLGVDDREFQPRWGSVAGEAASAIRCSSTRLIWRSQRMAFRSAQALDLLDNVGPVGDSFTASPAAMRRNSAA